MRMRILMVITVAMAGHGAAGIIMMLTFMMLIMLGVMLMRVLMVTTVAMAGLVIMMLTFMVLTCWSLW